MAETAEHIDQIFDFSLPARPYPGLRPFEKHEWPIFFGRERMTDDVTARLLRQRVVVIHGDSGCGKSSLVRAGMLPRLEQETARGGATWKTYAVTPGTDPVGNLARAFAGTNAGDWESELTFRRILNYDCRGAAAALTKVLRPHRDAHVCVLIDQFEELFAFAKSGSRTEAQLVTELLVGILQSTDETLHMILTMRSEFLGSCAQFPAFAEATNATQYLLPPMSHADLLRAIREPATLYGGEIEKGLAEQLIADVDGSPDQLPLIQHGLMLMHRKHVVQIGDANSAWKLRLDHYQTELGLSEMLSAHADAVQVEGERQAKAAGAQAGLSEELFRAITNINSEGHALRRPQRLEQLADVTGASIGALRALLDTFRAEGVCFVRPHGSTTLAETEQIDISHEAFLRCWQRIAEPRDGWLVRELKDGLVWRSLLVQTESFEQDPSNLLSFATSVERDRWMKRRNAAWCERYGGGWERVGHLIAASLEAGERIEVERRRQQGMRIILIAIVLLAIVSVIFGTIAYQARSRATSALTDTQAKQRELERTLREERQATSAAKQGLEQSRQKQEELLSLIEKLRTNAEVGSATTKTAQVDKNLREKLGKIEGILNEYSTLERTAQVRLSLTPTDTRYLDRIVYDVRIWIDIPPDRLSDVIRAEYFFNHDSFRPKLKTSTDAAHAFQLAYPGYGCVDATAALVARDGSRHPIPFDMCQLWVAAR